ncbi:MAG: inositol monophosphatase family protein [Bacteroidota bacterium]
MDYSAVFEEVKLQINKDLETILRLRDQRVSKKDKSFVTHGDLLVNDKLNGIFDKCFTDYLFVTEEAANHIDDEYNGFIVVIDPIDGTENFTSGFPEWGISISCFNKGVHQSSMLACPELNIWLKSGDKIQKHFSRIRGLSSSVTIKEIMEITQGHEYRILGCCVYNMINVIRGSFLSFENPKGANSWDILAGLNLALEHNLNVMVDGKRYHGEYLHPTKKYKFKVDNQ